MRTRTLDLTAIKVESFCTVGDAPPSAVANASEGLDCSWGCTFEDCEFTAMCSQSCGYSCGGTCASCGYSCQYCETDETDCSTHCFQASYVWEVC